jgi:hypothetical protein
MDVFNAVYWKAMVDTILAPKINESVKSWMEWLHEKGWSSLFELTLGEEAHGGFTMAFYSPWQCKVLLSFPNCLAMHWN